jgi:hypothetical protein
MSVLLEMAGRAGNIIGARETKLVAELGCSAAKPLAYSCLARKNGAIASFEAAYKPTAETQ